MFNPDKNDRINNKLKQIGFGDIVSIMVKMSKELFKNINLLLKISQS